MGIERLTVPVSGMSCQGCANKVEKALLRVPGVELAEVSFGARSATIERDGELATGAHLAAAIEALGFGVPPDAESAVRSLADDVAFAERAARDEARSTRRETALVLLLGALAIGLAATSAPPLLALLAAFGAAAFGGASIWV